MIRASKILAAVVLALASIKVMAAPAAPAAVQIDQLSVAGELQSDVFSFELHCRARADSVGASIALVSGAVSLVAVPSSNAWRLDYDAASSTYQLVILEGSGEVEVRARFVARAETPSAAPTWRQVKFAVADGRVRHVNIDSDQPDLTIVVADMLLPRRDRRADGLSIGGVLVPGADLNVRWQAQSEISAAELLVTSEASNIITISAGALRLDALFSYQINQGKLREMRFALPPGLSLTQVHGDHLQGWHVDSSIEPRLLIVRLNREQDKSYRLRLLGELVLEALPATVAVPVIQPQDGSRADGSLVIGTNSAIQIQVQQSRGLAQIDATAFPRLSLDPKQPRPLPQGTAFYYSFATSAYQAQLSLADVVASYDVEQRFVVTADDDDLTVAASFDLDVRDAPVRQLRVTLPHGFTVAECLGAQVADYAVRAGGNHGGEPAGNELQIDFTQPVLGRTLVEFRLESGKTPIDIDVQISGISVIGSREQRGYVVVAASQGVLIEDTTVQALRSVHTRSLPLRVADAQFAWRFRDASWSLTLPIRKRPASIRAELFHLLSLGDGIAYGSVICTYAISGAPVDELRFRATGNLEEVEFIGNDVNRWQRDGDLWIVQLRRKVIGDYNLAVTYTQRMPDGAMVSIGDLSCDGIESETGFITVASQLNLRVTDGTVDTALIPIPAEETPGHYRLLVNAPILRSYKYVSQPHRVAIGVSAYARGETPAVIIEFVDASSVLSIDRQRQAESITTVRYTIKNSSAQFLDLTVPDGVKVWATRAIEKLADGSEQVTRMTPSWENQTLKVPLRRQRDPNAPLTISIDYGQVHGRLGWPGQLKLSLPLSLVGVTYADWQLTAPSNWLLQPASDGSMASHSRATTGAHPLPTMLGRVLRAWLAVLLTPLAAAAAGAAIVLTAAARFWRRRWLLHAAVVTILLLSFFAGIGALARAGTRQPVHSGSSTLRLTQVLDLAEAAPMIASVQLQPAWRSGFSISWALLCLGTAAGCVVAVGKRYLAPRLGIAGVLASAIALASAVQPGAVLVMHALTWALPLLAGAAALLIPRRCATGRPTQRRTCRRPATLLLSIAALAASSAASAAAPLNAESVAVHLSVEANSVIAELQITVDSTTGGVLYLAPESTILLARPETAAAVYARRHGQHVLDLAAGRHQFALKLLLPLPAATPDQAQSLSLNLPNALSNHLQMLLPAAELDVVVADAIQMHSADDGETTTINAVLQPHRRLDVSWKPRGRRTQLEKTVIYAEIASLARADSGVVEVMHQVELRIAQGELTRLEVELPSAMTVTGVDADGIASWRFDPQTQRLLLTLEKPVTGQWALLLTTQIAVTTMPYTVRIEALQVRDALRSRSILAVVGSDAVSLDIVDPPQAMHADDFRRQATALLGRAQHNAQTRLHAYRLPDRQGAVTLKVTAVTAEISAHERSSFSVAGERLAFNTLLQLEIARTGIFSLDLILPPGYDVDSLSGSELSHWDDLGSSDSGERDRALRIHFNARLIGSTRLELALSQPLAQLPPVIDVPRVQVQAAGKHRGEVAIAAERGIQLSVAARDGVSELDVNSVNRRDNPALAFKLLRPDWQLRLHSVALAPRFNVEFLHLAEVSDGLVRHTHFIRHQLQNAGSKVFEFRIPADAIGVNVFGPEIARKEAVAETPGLWRIELAGTWFDSAYPLRVSYETRFDKGRGKLSIAAAESPGAERMHGYLVVRTTPTVELAMPTTPPAELRAAEARNVPGRFGAGDLSDAAFCFTTTSSDYALALRAIRHDIAELLQAEVLDITITSALSRHGDSIHKVQLNLKAGGKRHLVCQLPPGAQVWALLVDRQSRTPSFDGNSAAALLIPLPQSTGNELTVNIEFFYVLLQQPGQSEHRHDFRGPAFDLPLKNINWLFYVPPDFTYSDFGGTLTFDQSHWQRSYVSAYNISTYEAETARANAEDLQKALKLQHLGLNLARQGNQHAARQAMEQAYNYSVADQGLNEDARVNLRNLLQQQAVVGLVNRRGDIRQIDNQLRQPTTPAAPAQFTQQEAERLQGSLNKADSDNLARITDRILAIQEAAAGITVQLTVKLPQQGRLLRFSRPLQVEKNAEMRLQFNSAAPQSWQGTQALLAIAVLALGLSLLLYCPQLLHRLYAAVTPPPPSGAAATAANDDTKPAPAPRQRQSCTAAVEQQ